ncbi:hypothetical protein BKA59DRAFT_466716 [Fusarium tricinctum]|uniref:Zn(2)-C6 fungal-type domain-containing protein n=1 Tax=Fusarium tricinctum TaxID=61284 RepID=A0A8K0SBR8_9HYPO|nr:hypothetical protein BKA59DRAFT_466716 [Fusarium tricinctum]
MTETIANTALRRKLRAKTGCFTCRQRRKKCDEKSPICDLCNSSGRECIWPSADDMLDRRNAHHCASRHQIRRAKDKPQQLENDTNDCSILALNNITVQRAVPSDRQRREATDSICPMDLSLQAGLTHSVSTNHLELCISQHFSGKYFPLLLLPDCYRGFHDGWLTEIQQLMLAHKSLYYSVLACAASHMFLGDSVWEMHYIALSYYSQGVNELSVLLRNVSEYENHDALLMSVMLLYLYGYLELGIQSDVVKHVNAATHIIALRLFNRPTGIQRLFDKVALESVIYQQFLLTTGLWSETTQDRHRFNPDFWNRVEKLVDRSALLPGASRNLESPVLGVPLSLFRITVILRECYRPGININPEILKKTQRDVRTWESQLRNQDVESVHNAPEVSMLRGSTTRDETVLYALTASLLLEQLKNAQRGKKIPTSVSRDKWQIRMFLGILKRQVNRTKWAKSYAGTWPVYTLGLFLAEGDDRQIVVEDLERSWEVTKITTALRYHCDLESIWDSKT